MSDIDERIVFAENLREIMKEKGIEQKTLAQVIGVSDAAVSFWLNGRIKNKLTVSRTFIATQEPLRNSKNSD